MLVKYNGLMRRTALTARLWNPPRTGTLLKECFSLFLPIQEFSNWILDPVFLPPEKCWDSALKYRPGTFPSISF
jgi:hypothetical protein